jgi:hypothetical protein
MFPPQKIEIAFELRVDGVGICHAPAVWAGIFYKKGGFRAGTIYVVAARLQIERNNVPHVKFEWLSSSGREQVTGVLPFLAPRRTARLRCPWPSIR